MATHVYRLADAAPEAPYYANLSTVRLIPRHRRRDYLDIVLVVGGSGHHVTHTASGEQRFQRLVPGQLVLYRPVDELTIVGSEAEGLTIRQVAFPAADWETFSAFVGVDPAWITADEPPTVSLDPADADAQRPFIVALERFWDSPGVIDLVQFWIDVVPMFFPSHRRRDGAGAPLWLTDALAEMQEESNLRGGVDRLVELARVTPSHLAVVTRRYFARTPTALVSDLRLRHAAVLLSTTGESVGEIARRCGFHTFSYFSATFHRKHRLTPREFRSRSLGRFGGR